MVQAEEITLDDLFEVIPELEALSADSAAAPQILPGANRVPSPDLSSHLGPSFDFGRLHKSEPNLRVKLEEEARGHNRCSLMEARSISDYLRDSMQVPRVPRGPLDVFPGSLPHANKHLELTAFREPTPHSSSPLPPLPRLVKVEQPGSADQRLLQHTQAACQVSGLEPTDIKRETGLQPFFEATSRFAPYSFQDPFAPFSADADPWLLSNWESSHNGFNSKISTMKDALPSMFESLDSGSSDDKDSGLGDDLEPVTPKAGMVDAATRSNPAAGERTTAKWQNIIKKVPGHRTTFKSGRPRLCQFLLELLEEPDKYSYMIEWLDQERGVFKFVQSGEVARMWGRRRNKPQMKYENFARSLRTYIAKGILTKPRSKLVYRFAKVKN